MISRGDALRERARRRVRERRLGEPRITELGQAVEALHQATFELEVQKEESALRETEALEIHARLSAVANSSTDGIVIVDGLGEIEEVNDAAAAILGTDPGELVGTRAASVAPELDAAVAGEPGEILGRGNAGAIVPFEISRSEYTAGEAHGSVLTLRDVTRAPPRAASSEDSVQFFRQIAEQLEDVFYLVDSARGRVLYVSPAFRQLYGEELGSLAEGADAWLAIVHPDDRTRVREAVERFLRGDPLDEEHRIVRADGGVRLVRHRAFGIEGTTRVTGLVTDLTDDRLLERELGKAQKLELIGTLASATAHDFNNLLMGIVGCAQMALSHLKTDSPAFQHVQRALDAALRGSNLTRKLVAFGRQEHLGRNAIELDAAVESAHPLIPPLLGDGISLELHLGAPGARVLAEPGDIEQILLNLAANARDAVHRGGALVISTHHSNGDRFVVLSVSDDGAGMDERTLSRIFEPFFTTKRQDGGSGLGMASVAALTRRLGGTIRVHSEIGKGTRFRLRFPVTDTPETKVEAEPSRALATLPAVTAPSTVLLVEDAETARLTLSEYLRTRGYDVLAAASAEEALRIADENAIDAVVTDFALPGATGSELAGSLRRNQPHLPVLMMSGSSNVSLPEHARFLQKPFDLRRLDRELRELLGRGASRK